MVLVLAPRPGNGSKFAGFRTLSLLYPSAIDGRRRIRLAISARFEATIAITAGAGHGGILWSCILFVCAGCAAILAAYVTASVNRHGIARRYDTMRPDDQRTWRIGCGMIVAGLTGLGVISLLLPS